MSLLVQQDTLCRLMCSGCGRIFVAGDKTNCPNDGTELKPLRSDSMVGQIFDGKYKILDVVGAGGMSLVFKAEHLLLNRIVALKMLHGYLRGDDVSVRRFQQEARTCASFEHPNVVPIMDFGITQGGQPYLVMKFLDGQSLTRILRTNGAIPWREAIPIFIQACDALEAAHKAGIIHRDIKPGNIVILNEADSTGKVQVVDFGIAKMLKHDSEQDQSLTQAGEVFGSPLYMSPEQCEGRALDARSDMYSLGAVMFEALTGEPPLIGRSATETMQFHMHKAPPPMSAVAPNLDIPQALVEIVERLLAKSPADRYETMASVVQDLVLVLDSNGTHPGAEPLVTSTQRRGLLAHPYSGAVIFLLLSILWCTQGVSVIRNYRLTHLVLSAEKYMNEGDSAGALRVLDDALSISRHQSDHGAWQSRILGLFSTAYEHLGQTDQAEKYDRMRDELIKTEVLRQYGSAPAEIDRLVQNALTNSELTLKGKNLSDENSKQQVRELENASIICLNNNDPVRAERLVQRAVELQTITSGEGSVALLPLERQLARVALKTADFDKASDCFIASLRAAEGQSPSRAKSAVIANAKMGEALARRGALRAAAKYYQRSIQMAERNLPPTDPCVPAILRSFANVLKAQGRTSEMNVILARAQEKELTAKTCSPSSQSAAASSASATGEVRALTSAAAGSASKSERRTERSGEH